MVRLSRRKGLFGGLAFLAGPLLVAPSWASAPRLAALDWAMAESALALGAAPVALAEARAFARVTPLPSTAADFGLRGAPNLEALALAAPDLILSSSFYSFIEPRLAEIAPVFTRSLYGEGAALDRVTALLPDLAARLGLQASPVLARAEADFALLARALAAFPRPLVVLEPGDARHIRVFGADSLFGGVIARLGLVNGWPGATQFAFNAPLPLAVLADLPGVQLVLHGPVPPHVDLRGSRLWASLEPVRAGHVTELPEMNAFGGLPSALGFAQALERALARALA